MADGDLNVDQAMITQLRRLFRLEDKDLELIRQAGERVLPHVGQLVDGVYQHITSFPELAAVFHDEQSRQRFQAGERTQLIQLLSGVIDEEHVQRALGVGATHEERDIEPSWYLACYACYIESLLSLTASGTEDVPQDQLLGMCQALVKVILLDIALAWESYYRKKEQRIRDSYQALEASHNLALAMITQRDREIEELLKSRETHPERGPGG